MDDQIDDGSGEAHAEINRVEAEVLDQITENQILPVLSDLIGFESTGGKESQAQEYVAAFLSQVGAETDVWELDLDLLRTHPAFGMEIERESPVGVVGILGEDTGGPTLILNGHIDVVPPGDVQRWDYPPWRATVHDGRVYGRGSCDMKGGLTAILVATQAVARTRARLPGLLLVESVVGEEDGGVGTLAAVERGYRADGAIVAEPTALKVATASGGALSFRVTVSGLASHGALREEGVSAIEKFRPIHDALLQLEQTRNTRSRSPLYARYQIPFAISIGTIRAGDWPSSVPEELVFEGRYGVLPGENLEHARNEFEGTLEEVATADPWLRDHPPRVEWWGGQFAPASIPTDHPIVTSVSQAAADVGLGGAGVEGMPYGSDMRLLVEGNTPAVLFGPGDARVSHRPDEFVPIKDVLDCSRALALVILRWLEVESRPGHD